MADGQLNTKKIVGAVIFIILLVLSFLLLRPFLTAILSAFIFVYILYPVFRKLNRIINNPNISASIICILMVVILFFLTLFLVQTDSKEISNFSSFYQSKNISGSIESFILKISNDKDYAQGVGIIVDKGIEKAASAIKEGVYNILRNFPFLLLQFFIFFVLMFLSFINAPKIMEFLKNIFPFKESAKEKFLSRFKDVTSGVLYGIFVVGIIQGVSAGIGFLIFGVPQALLLTIASVIAVIVPYLGSAVIWIPVAASFMMAGAVSKGILLLVYGAVVIGVVENFVRPYIVSKKARINFIIIALGMIGGFELFGIVGAIVGPLIIDYLLLFIEFYKKGLLAELF